MNALLLGGLLIGLGLATKALRSWRFTRTGRAENHVSGEWLSEQKRDEYSRGIDGINWKWPVKR